MLQAAHCSVAVIGENRKDEEAIAASDVAIPSFAYLKPLLFIHGRLNCLRMRSDINHNELLINV